MGSFKQPFFEKNSLQGEISTKEDNFVTDPLPNTILDSASLPILPLVHEQEICVQNIENDKTSSHEQGEKYHNQILSFWFILGKAQKKTKICLSF